MQFIVVVIVNLFIRLFMFARQRHTPFILHALRLSPHSWKVYQHSRCCPLRQRPPFDLDTVNCSTLTIASFYFIFILPPVRRICGNLWVAAILHQCIKVWHLHICCKIFIPSRTP